MVLAIFRNCWLQAQPCPSAQVVRYHKGVRVAVLLVLTHTADTAVDRLMNRIHP